MKKERVIPTRSTQDFEKFINQLTNGKSMSARNYTEKTEFNATSYTIGDMANFIATMANELKKRGIL